VNHLINQAFTNKDLNLIVYGLLQDLHAARAEVNRIEVAVQKLKESIDEHI